LRLLSNIAAPAAFFSVLYVVLITDFVAKLITIQLKALVASIPAKFLCSRRQRRFFQFVECTSQLYRYFLPIPQWSRYFNYRLFSLPSLNSDHIFATIYICYKLSCGHIFCEECIGTWLDKEHTCPVCRATIALEDNTWKNGDTTFMPQIC
uniref:RING-type domain-containing protein n=1 Tax=Dracunculus medinensis TaxID=318479 RepID=A0A0N4UH52_DRAME